MIVSSGMGSRAGILQYLGETKFAPGNWCGVQLDEPSGKNDGTVEGVQYVLKKKSMQSVLFIEKITFTLLGILIVHQTTVYLFLWLKCHCHHYRANPVYHVLVQKNRSIQSAQWAALHRQIHHACE